PCSSCRHLRVFEPIRLFAAIELSPCCTARLDFNRAAVRLAREIGLPLLGASDSQVIRQFGTTYALIEASPTLASVLGAIRKGQVRVESRPLTLCECAGIVLDMVVADWRGGAGAT